MRCAILRLMSMGEPATGPRAMRDSEAIQATTLRRAWGPTPSPPPPPPQASKTSGQKVAPTLSNKGSRVLESTLPGLHFVEDIGNRWGSRRQVRGAKQRRDGEVPGFSGAAHAPGNPDIGRSTTSSGRRGRSRRIVGVEGRTTRIGLSRREKEARLLKLRRDRRELGDRGADHIPDGVMVQDPIPPTATSKGVISPAVENFSAHATSRGRDPTAACEDDAKAERKHGNRCRTDWQ